MNAKQIAATIFTGTFTYEELKEISEAFHFARGKLAKENSFTLRKGAKVQFLSSQTKQIETGVIEKVNRTQMIVNVGGLRYNVPAVMLSQAE